MEGSFEAKNCGQGNNDIELTEAIAQIIAHNDPYESR